MNHSVHIEVFHVLSLTYVHHLDFYLWEFQSTHRVGDTVSLQIKYLQKVTTNDGNKD